METGHLKKFTEWLSVVENETGYFFTEELLPIDIAREMLNKGEITIMQFATVHYFMNEGKSDKDIYEFLKISKIK